MSIRSTKRHPATRWVPCQPLHHGTRPGDRHADHSYAAANQVVGWSYDAAGNLLSDGTSTFTYDALGRMTSRGDTSYGYNGDGVLVAQTSEGVTTRYTQDLAVPMSQVLSDGSAIYLYGHERLAAQAAGTTTWYATDALGSLRQTLDNAGIPLATASYDPWGTPQGDLISPFGFTGELQTAQGLVYLRARWYNSATSTFTAVDPFEGFPELPYSQHPYQYAYSNPGLYVDPSGLCIGQCSPTPGPVPATPTVTPTSIPQGSGQGDVKSGGLVIGAPPYTGDTIRLPQLPELPRAPSGGAGRVGPGVVGLAGAAVGIVAYLNYCLSTIDPVLPSGPAPVPLSGPTTNQHNVLSLYHILTPGRLARFQQGGLYISMDGNRGPGLYLTPSFKDALFWGIRLGIQSGSEQVLRFDIDMNELSNLRSIIEDGTEVALYALEGRAIQNNPVLRRGFPSDPQQYRQVMGRMGASFAPYDYVAGNAARGFEYVFKSARSLEVLKRANTVLLDSKGNVIKPMKFP